MGYYRDPFLYSLVANSKSGAWAILASVHIPGLPNSEYDSRTNKRQYHGDVSLRETPKPGTRNPNPNTLTPKP